MVLTIPFNYTEIMENNIIPHSELNSLIKNIVKDYPSIYQDDLYQSCYLKALEKQEKTTSRIPAQWVTYLKARLKGVCDDFIRDEKKTAIDLDMDLDFCKHPISYEDTDSQFTDKDTLRTLERYFSARDWQILNLRYISGYSAADIAEVLNLSVRQIHYIISKLKNKDYDSI